MLKMWLMLTFWIIRIKGFNILLELREWRKVFTTEASTKASTSVATSLIMANHRALQLKHSSKITPKTKIMPPWSAKKDGPHWKRKITIIICTLAHIVKTPIQNECQGNHKYWRAQMFYRILRTMLTMPQQMSSLNLTLEFSTTVTMCLFQITIMFITINKIIILELEVSWWWLLNTKVKVFNSQVLLKDITVAKSNNIDKWLSPHFL